MTQTATQSVTSSDLASQDTALAPLFAEQQATLSLKKVARTGQSILARDRRRWNAAEEFSYIDIRRGGQSAQTREILSRVVAAVRACPDPQGVLLTDLQKELEPIFRYSHPQSIAAMLTRQSDYHTLVVKKNRVRQATPIVVKMLAARHREARRLKIRTSRKRAA